MKKNLLSALMLTVGMLSASATETTPIMNTDYYGFELPNTANKPQNDGSWWNSNITTGVENPDCSNCMALTSRTGDDITAASGKSCLRISYTKKVPETGTEKGISISSTLIKTGTTFTENSLKGKFTVPNGLFKLSMMVYIPSSTENKPEKLNVSFDRGVTHAFNSFNIPLTGLETDKWVKVSVTTQTTSSKSGQFLVQDDNFGYTQEMLDGDTKLNGFEVGNTKITIKYIGAFTKFYIDDIAIERIPNVVDFYNYEATTVGTDQNTRYIISLKSDLKNALTENNAFTDSYGYTLNIGDPLPNPTNNVGQYNSKWVSMAGMFEDCSGMTAINLSEFNTKCTYDMSNMFKGCSSLNELVLDNILTPVCNNMNSMFEGCSNITRLDLKQFDILAIKDNVTQNYKRGNLTWTDMFKNCGKNVGPFGPAKGWILNNTIAKLFNASSKETGINSENLWFVEDVDPATGTESVKATNCTVYGTNGSITVNAEQGTSVKVYDLSGRTLHDATVEGETTVDAAAGIYIVKAGGKTTKVIVK